MVKEIQSKGNKKYPNKAALVDDEDFEVLNKFSWYSKYHHYNFYVYRQEYDRKTKHNKTIFMARQILNATKGVQIDHINHDELDNRRCNIRLCSHSENQRNANGKFNRVIKKTSKYKGVNYCKERKGRKKWLARIRINGKDKLLGYYQNELNAALGYDEAARKYYKEFAHTNFKHLTVDNLYNTLQQLRKLNKTT